MTPADFKRQFAKSAVKSEAVPRRPEDTYIRANYNTISELCQLNGIPFNARPSD
jgi:hypothetical protein